MSNLTKKTAAIGSVVEKTSIAFHAVISPKPSAIAIPGQDDECVRITLDLYPQDEEQVQRLMGLRGRELFVVLTEDA